MFVHFKKNQLPQNSVLLIFDEIFPHLSCNSKIKREKMATLIVKRIEFNRFWGLNMYLCNQSHTKSHISIIQLPKNGDKRVSFTNFQQSHCLFQKNRC